ncbi:MAG: hypothetical protein JWO36_3477 [Myxococcales bacterium]|nr:hypothetical protein [Myxococcales bacterium]
MPPLTTCTPSTVVSPEVARSENVKLTGPSGTPGNHTTPRAPVPLSVNAVGVIPSKNGPLTVVGIEVAVTPETGCPRRRTVATTDPDPGNRPIPCDCSICSNNTALSAGIVFTTPKFVPPNSCADVTSPGPVTVIIWLTPVVGVVMKNVPSEVVVAVADPRFTVMFAAPVVAHVSSESRSVTTQTRPVVIDTPADPDPGKLLPEPMTGKLLLSVQLPSAHASKTRIGRFMSEAWISRVDQKMCGDVTSENYGITTVANVIAPSNTGNDGVVTTADGAGGVTVTAAPPTLMPGAHAVPCGPVAICDQLAVPVPS